MPDRAGETAGLRVLVTAFGPFGGRERNASSMALVELARREPWISRRLLPVDSVVAPSRLRQALARLRPDALLMLGEAASCRAIRLEHWAWNELDFRIPDLGGRQPRARPIERGGPERVASTLPLDFLEREIRAIGLPVERSDDPGRYLCNQLFFTARRWLACRGLDGVPAGFVHLPLESTIEPERVADGLAAALRVLRAGGTAGENGG